MAVHVNHARSKIQALGYVWYGFSSSNYKGKIMNNETQLRLKGIEERLIHMSRYL